MFKKHGFSEIEPGWGKITNKKILIEGGDQKWLEWADDHNKNKISRWKTNKLYAKSLNINSQSTGNFAP